MKTVTSMFVAFSLLVAVPVFASVDINLVGGTVTVEQGKSYNEPGYSAFSTTDGDVTGQVQSYAPATNVPGDYFVEYEVTDSALDYAYAARQFTVVAPAAGQMFFCSGPMAPGWTVGLVNGGCPVAEKPVYKAPVLTKNANGTFTLSAVR